MALKALADSLFLTFFILILNDELHIIFNHYDQYLKILKLMDQNLIHRTKTNKNNTRTLLYTYTHAVGYTKCVKRTHFYAIHAHKNGNIMDQNLIHDFGKNILET